MSRPFGIDLGTTYSAVATLDDSGTPRVSRNENGEETTPSVVWFEGPGSVVVGSTAKESAVIDPDAVVSLVKRQMGTTWSQTFFGEKYTAESVSALILRNLVDGAIATTGNDSRDVVITVPAYFGQLEREATKAAGQIAGLNVLSIIPEPVAAALHYGVANDVDGRTILVFDLGGGTFDVSVMTVEDGKFRVLVTDGDEKLGGSDWDNDLVQLILERYVSETGDVDATFDEQFIQEITNKAEQTKKNLSNAEQRKLPLRRDGNSATIVITRTEFTDLTRPLLQDTISITRRALSTLAEKHGITTIDEAVLVGGSTRMPAVADALQAAFGWSPKLHDPDLAVAKGAALFALGRQVHASAEAAGGAAAIEQVAMTTRLDVSAVAAIANKETRNVLPKAIGVELMDNTGRKYVDIVIDQNTAIPLAVPVMRSYGTATDNQTAVQFILYQQSSPLPSPDVDANMPIDQSSGRIVGFPPRPAGDRIDVQFHVDAEGAVELVATHANTGRSLTMEVRVAVLSENEVAAQSKRVSMIKVSGS